MKKYEYVKLDGNKFFGASYIEHRRIIDQYAEKGYSYVGYIPLEITDYGKIKEIDLIFEKED